MNCLNCHATTTNGLALCDLCQRKVTLVLDVLPVYFRNLARNRRPGRPNGSLGTSGQWLIKRGESEGSAIQHALDRVGNDLSTWARALSDDRNLAPEPGDDETGTVAALCDFFLTNLTSIATLEWAGQFVNDMSRHERTLRELTETAVPGWYAGRCQRRVTMEGKCEAETFVVPGLTWVTCGMCGATTYARDHLNTVIDEARGWVARPKAIAEALVALMDSEQSVPRLYDRIRKWESLEWLEATRKLDKDGDPIGAKRYRLGDVFDLATGKADAPTRVKTTSA